MRAEAITRGVGDDEVAAVVAAYLLTRPRVVLEAAGDPTPVWRFSGRWFGRSSRRH